MIHKLSQENSLEVAQSNYLKYISQLDGNKRPLDTMTLGNCTTSCNEAEHRVYKHHAQGPRPADNVHTCAQKVNLLNEKKEATKCRQVAADMRGTVGNTKTREQVDDRLTNNCNKLLLSEHSQGTKNYFIHRPSQYMFYVKRNYS